MSIQGRLAKWAAVSAGGLGCIIALSVLIGQLNLRDVFSGRMPLGIAIALGSNAFPFLLILLLICVLGITIALWKNFPWIRAGVIWLGIGGILVYAVYLSRFSMGPFLIPSTALFIIAGGFALWQHWR